MSPAPPDLLGTIVAAARRGVETREAVKPRQVLEAGLRTPPVPRAFEDALHAGPGPRIIAECKRRSPSRGILRGHYDAAAHARAYELAGAAAISVLTEPTFFDGAPDHLSAVRAAVRIPILRKDFIVTDYQIVEAAALGADAVLLIAGAVDDGALQALMRTAENVGLAALVEVHDEEELRRAAGAGARLIGVNSRNLRTLAVDRDVHARLARHLTGGVIAVAESGIRSRADVERATALGYHACLVGERLIAQPDPGAALAELRRC